MFILDFGCWHSGLNDTDICVNGLGAHDALSLYKIGQGNEINGRRLDSAFRRWLCRVGFPC